MRKYLISAAAFLFSGAVFYPFPSVADSAAPGLSTIRVGYITDLSGKGAFLGQQSTAGAELARRELEREGKPMTLTVEDCLTDGKAAAASAQKLLNVDRVDAVLCDLTLPCSAASPIVAAAKKLFPYQSPADSIREKNPYAFQHFLDYTRGCRAIAEHWKRIGLTKIGNLKANTEFGELCLKGAKEIFPDQTVIDYDIGTDLRSLVVRLRSAGVQAALQTGFEADYISRLRATADLDWIVPIGMPEPLLTAAVTQTVADKYLEGTVVFGFPRVAPEFIAKLRSEGLYKTDVAIDSAAIAYIHMRQLSEALRQCAPADIDCQLTNLSRSNQFGNILRFQGWQDRQAIYPTVLRLWKNNGLTELAQ